eukprot:1104891-Heterocapsa_arctica.AAC.1
MSIESLTRVSNEMLDPKEFETPEGLEGSEASSSSSQWRETKPERLLQVRRCGETTRERELQAFD